MIAKAPDNVCRLRLPSNPGRSVGRSRHRRSPGTEVPEGWLRIKISHASLNRHDGSEDEFGPGEVSLLPPGHDAWVVGNEPVVVIDISGMVNYAKPA